MSDEQAFSSADWLQTDCKLTDCTHQAAGSVRSSCIYMQLDLLAVKQQQCWAGLDQWEIIVIYLVI